MLPDLVAELISAYQKKENEAIKNAFEAKTLLKETISNLPSGFKEWVEGLLADTYTDLNILA